MGFRYLLAWSSPWGQASRPIPARADASRSRRPLRAACRVHEQGQAPTPARDSTRARERSHAVRVQGRGGPAQTPSPAAHGGTRTGTRRARARTREAGRARRPPPASTSRSGPPSRGSERRGGSPPRLDGALRPDRHRAGPRAGRARQPAGPGRSSAHPRRVGIEGGEERGGEGPGPGRGPVSAQGWATSQRRARGRRGRAEPPRIHPTPAAHTLTPPLTNPLAHPSVMHSIS